MGAKKKLLTQAEYEQLSLADEWRIVELPLSNLVNIPGVQRKDDILGAYSSGDLIDAKSLNNKKAILGMDVIVYERKPKVHRGEGNINVYHYVVIKSTDPALPYCLRGPFTKQALQEHWPRVLDTTPYE